MLQKDIVTVCNSKLPGIRRITDKNYGIGVIYSRTDQEKISYCQRCLEIANIYAKLANRIYLPNESGDIVIPPDYDLWRQCHECGTVYPRYEVKQEAELTSLTEPRNNPFKFGNTQVRTEESRKFDRTGKTQHKRKFKQDLEQYKEEDVKAALRKGSKLVSYQEK
jgi:hypothetical protein